MDPEFRAHVTNILAAYYGIPAAEIERPRTVLRLIEPEDWDEWLELIPVGAGAGIAIPPHLWDAVAAVHAAHPGNHLLSGADFQAAWGQPAARIGHFALYMLDRALFRPFTPDSRYTVRALTAADAAAFAAFQARCSAPDLEESDISLEQEAPYGVFDGDRMVAGTSTYMWVGLVDVGVLTDPDYRRQGLGKAAVSAACAHSVNDPAESRIVCYRHGLNNAGSRRIAESLGFSFYATVECVYRAG
jgi:RimJ/RimL family protein N-acetyltransferase